ncbi:MAG: TM2 domain-containing protein [Gemmatimonadetes bacterium]|nr:TM2 domain-containing protein [Gemmatimonadota bacterium]NNM06592.1 TM2 domain-containing protein [Gemmatimonadota bacterium]
MEPRGSSLQTSPGSYHLAANRYPNKNRSISVGLALVFGGIGAHKFYVDKPGKGLLYMLFSWTGIPSLIGIFEAVKYIRMDEEEYHQKFFRGEL